MTGLKKDIRYTVRVNDAHNKKLRRILESKGLTVSQWVREKIEQSRLSK